MARNKKTTPAERDVRGGLNDGDLYATARRAAQQMRGTTPRGKKWGNSEAHAISARDDGEAGPSGSFDVPKRGKL